MHRYQKIVALILTLSFLLVACGGGGDKPPVPMEKRDAGGFSLEHPKDWHIDVADMFGLTIIVGSNTDMNAEEFLQSGDPSSVFGDAPGIFIMAVPPDMADGEFDLSLDEVKNLSQEEPDVEFIKQGEIEVDGVQGYQIVGKGQFQTMGSDAQSGVNLTVLEGDNLSLAFIGFSPVTDIDKNLDIFSYIVESIKFE